MHVMVVPSWYSSKENPMHGSFFKEQFLSLKEKGLNITVCYNEIWPITKMFKNNDKSGIFHELDSGLDTYRYKGYNFIPKCSKMFSIFNMRMEKLYLRAVKDKGRVDIIHAHSCFWGGISAAYVSEKYNIPLVITEHSSLVYAEYCRESYKPFIYSAYDTAEVVIAVSNSLKNEVEKYTSTPVRVIHNMVDDNRFTIKSGKRNNFTFLSCGYLVSGKGFEQLLSAFSAAFNGTDVQLRIAGDGVLRHELQDKINEFKLNDNVKLLGLVTRDELKSEMNKCDAFVLPSEHETFGMVYVEALSCGKPVIGAYNGGAEDIINSTNGILVEVNNIKELKDALINLKANIQKYSAEKLREDCLINFSSNSISNCIIDVYREVKGAK